MVVTYLFKVEICFKKTMNSKKNTPTFICLESRRHPSETGFVVHTGEVSNNPEAANQQQVASIQL